MWLMYLLLTLCLVYPAIVDSNEILPGKVIFSSVMFRHGNRSMIQAGFLRNDPFEDSTRWANGWGQLTDIGKVGQYKLGQWLRVRYKSLLPKKYNYNDIYVRSTDVDRTIMSAQCALAGLYQPNSKTNWDPNIAWDPIPVHTESSSHEQLLGNSACPKYTKLNNELFGKKMSELIATYPEAINIINNNTNVENSSNPLALLGVWDTLKIEELSGCKLPPWSQKVYPEPLTKIASAYYSSLAETDTMARLYVGSLLKEMIEHMKQKANKTLTPDRKMWMYSAHDATVAAVLQAFKVYDDRPPPFSATLLLELREKEDQHFVTLSYRNSSAEPFPLTIPGCYPACPLDQFETLLQPVLPDNLDEECQLDPQ